ncbi:hypothetical protein CRG98_048347 [Punica granatum]|uniref:Protein kinase domain-containing protein n=1 Tax=Punica granatum TaxID=22663 RepID=A0A2I0HI20_PUNGR|nr:hypothetical protein CRG98_048347 [Punica granatum]
MNPKISDFGLARVFQATQDLMNTHRVVGTLGYMSPEYVMGGMFSEKSDVYSFGVLMLEIISSKKNTSLCYHGKILNLLSYAWELWREGRGMELLDEAILTDSVASIKLEVMKCIHIGLLCIQDHATDRPNMLSVILMLSGESDPPNPKPPSLTSFQSSLDHEVHGQRESPLSINTMTCTTIEGR